MITNSQVNSPLNFKAKLVADPKCFSKKINLKNVEQAFAEKTKSFNKDFVVGNEMFEIMTWGYIPKLKVDGIYDLKVKKITDENVLVDKLVRAYKMITSYSKYKKATDVEDLKFFEKNIKDLARKDNDLNRNAKAFLSDNMSSLFKTP